MTSYNVLFLCNGHKARLYQSVSVALEAEKVSSVLITTNGSYLDNTITSKVEYFNKFQHYDVVNKEIENDLCIERYINQDRVLRYQKDADLYLIRYARFILQYLTNNKIDLIISEFTWAWELVTKDISDILGVKHLAPFRVRIPPDRVFWTNSKFNDFIIPLNVGFQEDIVVTPPSYIKSSVQFLDRGLTLRAFIERSLRYLNSAHYLKSDIMQFDSFKNRVRNGLSSFVNVWAQKGLKYQAIDVDDNVYVYTLHKQPESSVDVLGYYYSNQLLTIKRINEIIPPGAKLYVKPHMLSKNDFGRNFYRELRIKGIPLLHPAESMLELMKAGKIEGVFTISGTVALEAHLIGVDAYVFSRVFYGLKFIHSINWEVLNNAKRFSDLKTGTQNTEIYKTRLNHSVRLNIADPAIDERVLNGDNIKQWVSSILKLLLWE